MCVCVGLRSDWAGVRDVTGGELPDTEPKGQSKVAVHGKVGRPQLETDDRRDLQAPTPGLGDMDGMTGDEARLSTAGDDGADRGEGLACDGGGTLVGSLDSLEEAQVEGDDERVDQQDEEQTGGGDQRQGPGAGEGDGVGCHDEGGRLDQHGQPVRYAGLDEVGRRRDGVCRTTDGHGVEIGDRLTEESLEIGQTQVR